MIKNGIVSQVFKGTIDEVNNSIFLTSHFHVQHYPLQVTRLVSRDFHLKLLRSARIILTFYTKTEHREIVKRALHGDLRDKLECLKKIDFTNNYDFNKNQNKIDIYKTVAFQIGQVLGLKNNKEFYCKESISKEFPDLEKYLMRQDSDLNNLGIKMTEYNSLLESELVQVKKLRE